MRIRKVAVWVATAALALGLMGAGVSAIFTWQGTAVQAVDVGTFDFQLDSSTPGASVSGDTLTCPTFHIASAYPTYGAGGFVPGTSCNIQVKQVGSIDNAKVSVYMQVTSSGADLTKFTVTPNGAHWFVFPPLHSPSYTLNDFTGAPVIGGNAGMIGQWIGAMPASIDMPIDWSELNNADLGKAFTVTYTLYVYE